MKITLTIEATAQDIKLIQEDLYGFAKDVEGILRRRRLTTPIIDISGSGFPTLKWKEKNEKEVERNGIYQERKKKGS